MKYTLSTIFLYIVMGCSSLNITSKVIENQTKYLNGIDAEFAEPYKEINLVFKDVAVQIESKIEKDDTNFLKQDTIFVLNALDFETGIIYGHIWSSKKSFSYEIGCNRPHKVEVVSGLSDIFKENKSIIEECQTMEVKARELNPGEIEGGLYFLLSRVINYEDLNIETIAFEQW